MDPVGRQRDGRADVRGSRPPRRLADGPRPRGRLRPRRSVLASLQRDRALLARSVGRPLTAAGPQRRLTTVDRSRSSRSEPRALRDRPSRRTRARRRASPRGRPERPCLLRAPPASGLRRRTSGRRATTRGTTTAAGVSTRSLPRDTENSRNSSVMTTQTTWKPTSAPSVWQYPSRKKPVTGSKQQGSSSPPRTFTRTSLRPAGDEPAASAEARRHQRQPHEDEDDERRPDPAYPPVLCERRSE